jgi:hypothetical protein
MIVSLATGVGSPFMKSEFTLIPSPAKAEPGSSTPASAGRTTCRVGSPNVAANSQSRWSCAGTAMIAPVPYLTST